MADMTELNFDANDVEPQGDFTPIPAGDYLAVIVESEMKLTKSGGGTMLVLTFEIIEGEHEKRRLWARLNLINPSKQAVEIARSELSSICRAVGVFAPYDSQELHNLPILLRVGLVKRADNGELTNAIKGYRDPHAEAEKAAEKVAKEPTPKKETATTSNGTDVVKKDKPVGAPWAAKK